MAGEEIIPIELFCTSYQVEESFLETLESYGLISITIQDQRRFILMEEIVELEKFSRLYYELEINVPGIEALQHMMERIKQMQQELADLKARLKIYE
jgi:hypothetical protein